MSISREEAILVARACGIELVTEYDEKHPHPDARPDWKPGATNTPDWACKICGKPHGH